MLVTFWSLWEHPFVAWGMFSMPLVFLSDSSWAAWIRYIDCPMSWDDYESRKGQEGALRLPLFLGFSLVNFWSFSSFCCWYQKAKSELELIALPWDSICEVDNYCFNNLASNSSICIDPAFALSQSDWLVTLLTAFSSVQSCVQFFFSRCCEFFLLTVDIFIFL